MGRSSTSTDRAIVVGSSFRMGTGTAPGVADWLLVGGVVVMAVGLAAVLASLPSFAMDGVATWHRPPTIAAQREPCPCSSPGDSRWPHAGPEHLDRGSTQALRSPRGTTGPWEAPHDSQTDRAHRGRLQGDWRIYLRLEAMRARSPTRTAGAPAPTTTPGPRFMLSHPHGVD